MVRIAITDFDHRIVPHRMEIRRLATVRIDRLTEEFHRHISSPTLIILAGMERLVESADKMDQVLEGFLMLLTVCVGIRQHVPKAFDLTNATPIGGTYGLVSYSVSVISMFT